MESNKFYNKISEYINNINKEELVDFVNNIIRKIPESKFEEILYIINGEKSNINEIEINQRIEKYKKFLKKLDENLKNKVIKWLEELIEKRVDAIMEGNYRKLYYKVALLVVFYGEILESQNLKSKKDYIKYFENKYSRRSAFKSELRELL